MLLDIKIINGTVIDGTGRQMYRADVGISGDRIEVIGDLTNACCGLEIDASGCFVMPGFIDIHSHSDSYVVDHPGLDSKLRQGVTTEVTGNCGHSAAPYDPRWGESTSRSRPWPDVASFFSFLEQTGIGCNLAMLAGHGTLRMAVVGPAARKASSEEIEKMKALLEECLKAGCIGLSSGLIYPPGMFADEDELASLASVLPKGYLYSTHIRNESSLLFQALDEAFATARRSGSRLQISHLKACGRDVWGKIPMVLELIEEQRSRAVDVSFDAYPYNATQTGIRQLFPPWTHDGGRAAFVSRLKDRATRSCIVKEIQSGDTSWENTFASAGPDNIVIGASRSGRFEGRRLTDIAIDMGLPAIEAACEIAIAEEGEASIITFEMKEEDVSQVLAHPQCCICSDGSGLTDTHRSHVHPRSFAAFAKFLSEYLLRRRLVPLEEGIRRMTSLPASRANLQLRGRLERGYYADIAIVDPGKLAANADFANPRRYATGFRYVLVNGQVAVENDRLTGIRAGKVIRF